VRACGWLVATSERAETAKSPAVEEPGAAARNDDDRRRAARGARRHRRERVYVRQRFRRPPPDLRPPAGQGRAGGAACRAPRRAACARACASVHGRHACMHAHARGSGIFLQRQRRKMIDRSFVASTV
jgi:hypothetical protein